MTQMSQTEIEYEFRRQIYAHDLTQYTMMKILLNYFGTPDLISSMDGIENKAILSFRRQVKLCSGLGKDKMRELIAECKP